MQKIIGTVQTLPQQIRGNIKPTIASSGEEYQKGYDEGYKIGKDEGYDGGFADGKDQGYEDGKNSVVQLDRIAKSIQLVSLNDFGKSVVELSFEKITSFTNFIQVTSAENANTIVEHLIINCSTQPTNVLQMIYFSGNANDNTGLKRFTFNVDTSKTQNFSNFVGGNGGLEIIDGKPIDFSSNTQTSINPFARCGALKEVRFVAETINQNFTLTNNNNLSTDTIQSIIDGLADLTGQTQQTLTLHSSISGKLTDEQYNEIFNKNWNIN